MENTNGGENPATANLEGHWEGAMEKRSSRENSEGGKESTAAASPPLSPSPGWGTREGNSSVPTNSDHCANFDKDFEAVRGKWDDMKQQIGVEVEGEVEAAIWWAAHVAKWEEDVEQRDKDLEGRAASLNVERLLLREKAVKLEEKEVARARKHQEADLRLREEECRHERLLLREKAVKLEEEAASRAHRLLEPRWYRYALAGGADSSNLSQPLISSATPIPDDVYTTRTTTTAKPTSATTTMSSVATAMREVYPDGTYLMVPWSERPTIYDVRACLNLVESTSESKDPQMVKVGLRVLTRPCENFDERVLTTIIHESLEAVVARYDASQLTTQRETLHSEISHELTERARNLKISLDDVSITSLSLLPASEAERAKFIDEKADDNRGAIIKAQDEDATWNKHMDGYVFFLGVALSMLFIVRPLLPHGYDHWMLAGFAMVWGLGSIGIPLGMFGTTRIEKNISRHIGRFISLCFSLMVIYATYLLAKPMDARSDSTSDSSPSPSQSGADSEVTAWTITFIAIGAIVMAGHIISWSRGCCFGGDRDLQPR